MSAHSGVSTAGSSMSGTNAAAGTACGRTGAVRSPAANGAPTTAWIVTGSTRTACVDDGRTTTAGPATGAMVAVVDWFVVRLAPLLGMGQLALRRQRCLVCRGWAWGLVTGVSA